MSVREFKLWPSQGLMRALFLIGAQLYMLWTSVKVYTDWLGPFDGDAGRYTYAAPFAFIILFIPLNTEVIKLLRRHPVLTLSSKGLALDRFGAVREICWDDISDINFSKENKLLGLLPSRPGILITSSKEGKEQTLFLSPLTIDFQGPKLAQLVKSYWKP